ncbi:chorismate synthase [Bifidobacterium pseudolongum subsp. globosum]|uniref:chorismate synthase n=1 Tax=Bifidobacterium pseudolongum TaxID=1694 RepID=UPI0010218806|nr:chorismate synthase [Bifidobacterium pseudolongum]RYQ04478.1 chorismate synthase [Bifidobacterium pseudolongum subsp. globosum]RYQ09539.1 chorismate synthase [Bifidobacterium pseudolongum subsp. globosum]RYQ14467.1 chorismate synthase [Bifidobacterium pseudolongum subsp. globosum]RYQ15943.1 chorismate synthase [Bifidobacterium pseudolongum subsp. globosum]RYQ73036.1 chorismate synthase [Bifidobacterium pseudolongum subsp. globosum]
MLRWQTAGESHGEALVAMIEGVPAGVEVTSDDIRGALARRRLGYGRGARMKFEQDQVRLLTGVRHGSTLGSPIAIEIGNTEWPKWTKVMSADPLDHEIAREGRNAPLSRPRPGHADLTGMRKYGFDDARPVLERSSARETASRVALGEVAARFLEQVAGIRTVSHVLSIGGAGVEGQSVDPTPDDVERLDASPVRTLDSDAEARMIARIDEAKANADTLGGVVEVIAYGMPAGVGTYVESDRRLDAALAAAAMGVQAIKGVEIGDGFLEAMRPGSQAHDEMVVGDDGHIDRLTNRAGGIEGGMSNGQPIRVRAAMKPIPSIPRALRTVDVATGEAAQAINQRSDSTAVPAAAVVVEAMVRLTLARELLEKFGGDSVDETRRNLEGYLASWPEHMR